MCHCFRWSHCRTLSKYIKFSSRFWLCYLSELRVKGRESTNILLGYFLRFSNNKVNRIKSTLQNRSRPRSDFLCENWLCQKHESGNFSEHISVGNAQNLIFVFQWVRQLWSHWGHRFEVPAGLGFWLNFVTTPKEALAINVISLAGVSIVVTSKISVML